MPLHITSHMPSTTMNNATLIHARVSTYKRIDVSASTNAARVAAARLTPYLHRCYLLRISLPSTPATFPHHKLTMSFIPPTCLPKA